MKIFKGIGVSHGVSVGPAFIMESERSVVRRRQIQDTDVEEEVARFKKAIHEAVNAIKSDQQRLAPKLGDHYLDIFKTHIRMLEDRRLHEDVIKRIIADKYTAEAAVDETLQKHIQLLFEDKSTARWVSDIYDIQTRLRRLLTGRSTSDVRELQKPVIVVAEDLMPSQTVNFEREKVLAIAMETGGVTSHTAIIANALGIPAVVGLKGLTASVKMDERIIVDGLRGEVIIDPDPQTLTNYIKIEKDIIESDRRLIGEQQKLPAETLDGRSISLFANIEFPYEVRTALEKGAEGIGLYRTEYLYMEKGREPTEDEHFQAYKNVAQMMWPRPVIIRTFDLGADKAAAATGGPAAGEPNPFLGSRSIRLCFDRVGMFKSQLRAILRASVHGYIKILFPMITSLWEISRARQIVQEVHDELDSQGIEHESDIEIGMMIEVPSAAVLADSFAKHVDFFSIGTNDLIQYTLAVDRGNPVVAHLFQPAHPAVMKLIKHTIEAGDEAGIPVEMCGQMSGDLSYLVLLLGLGLREFSTSPNTLPELKRAIRLIRIDDAREVAAEVMQEPDIERSLEILTTRKRELIGEL